MTTATEFEDWLASQLEALANEADMSVRPEFGSAIERGLTRWSQRSTFLVATAAIVALVGAGLLTQLGLRSEGTSSGVSAAELVQGLDIAVTGLQRREAGTTIYQAKPGPAPLFDPSVLGTEFPLTALDPADVVVPVESWFIFTRSQLGSTFIALGEIDRAQIGLNASSGGVCVFLGNYTSTYGGGECDQGREEIPLVLSNPVPALDPPIGLWTAVVGIPPQTSVVAAHFADGSVQWQQAIGRTGFFLREGSGIDRFIFYDMSGNEIAQ